jgi:hypothetical protein
MTETSRWRRRPRINKQTEGNSALAPLTSALRNSDLLRHRSQVNVSHPLQWGHTALRAERRRLRVSEKAFGRRWQEPDESGSGEGGNLQIITAVGQHHPSS